MVWQQKACIMFRPLQKATGLVRGVFRQMHTLPNIGKANSNQALSIKPSPLLMQWIHPKYKKPHSRCMVASSKKIKDETIDLQCLFHHFKNPCVLEPPPTGSVIPKVPLLGACCKKSHSARQTNEKEEEVKEERKEEKNDRKGEGRLEGREGEGGGRIGRGGRGRGGRQGQGGGAGEGRQGEGEGGGAEGAKVGTGVRTGARKTTAEAVARVTGGPREVRGRKIGGGGRKGTAAAILVAASLLGVGTGAEGTEADEGGGEEGEGGANRMVAGRKEEAGRDEAVVAAAGGEETWPRRKTVEEEGGAGHGRGTGEAGAARIRAGGTEQRQGEKQHGGGAAAATTRERDRGVGGGGAGVDEGGKAVEEKGGGVKRGGGECTFRRRESEHNSTPAVALKPAVGRERMKGDRRAGGVTREVEAGQGEDTALQGQGRRSTDSLGDCTKPRPVTPSPTSAQEHKETAEEATQSRCGKDSSPRRGTTRGKHEQGRTRRSILNTCIAAVLKFYLLLTIIGEQLICVGAGPVPVSLQVEGWGRTLQGESYRLVCVVTPPQAAHTSPAFSWYRNGTLLVNQTGQELNFSPLSKSDEGNYRCHLNSENMERDQPSDPYTLRVIVFENISLVPEVEVEEGQTVILNCSVHSDPTAFLTWRVGDKTVYTVRSNSDSLVIHNAWLYHRVVVECEAYNDGLVLGFLDAYSLIRRKGTYEIMATPQLSPRGVPVLHRPFGMECVVLELPNQGVNVHLTYTWYKDDKVMEDQSDMILDFPSLRKEDSGLYTCTARNGKPRTTSPQSNALEVGVLIPPVVHIEPRPPDNVIKQPAGETLTLICKVTEAFPGVAPNGYRWSYLPSPRGQLRPLEGRESTLTLGPLTREDSGQYICQAWNYEDFDGLLPPGNASVTVDVMYLENITSTPAIQVNEGDNVTLSCSVDSNPAARLSWLVEGREVRHVTANVDHYVLERAACSDNKTYTCRASIPHLPGLELNTSTEILVNCTNDGANITALPDSVPWIVGVAMSSLVVVGLSVVTVWRCCFIRNARCNNTLFCLEKHSKPGNACITKCSRGLNTTNEDIYGSASFH